jgi:hypothetical protein
MFDLNYSSEDENKDVSSELSDSVNIEINEENNLVKKIIVIKKI